MMRSNKLPYIYVFLILLQGFNVHSVQCSQSEEELSEIKEFDQPQRQKRIFGAIIAGASAIIGAVASLVTAINSAPRDTPIVSVTCDGNCDVKMKELASDLATDVRKESSGHYTGKLKWNMYCNAEFCSKLGRLGEAAFGTKCNNEFCHCDTGGRAHLKSCGSGTIFDPVHRVCNWPYNLGC